MKYKILFIITAIMIVSFPSMLYSGEVHMHQEEMVLSGTLQNGIRVIEVKAYRYGFDPDPIVVEVNEKVRLEAISTDVTHGMAIKDLGINLVVPKDKIASIEFKPEKIGTFRTRCSIFCGLGHGRMRGTLVVVE